MPHDFRLFSYTLRIDDGAAPNPYWGYCTLAICKPSIRRVANVGDWVVGLGAKTAPTKGIDKHVVYAMKVTNKLLWSDYENFALEHCPKKIPNINHQDVRVRLGDCIYDYSVSPPAIRNSVHGEGDRQTDLGGKNVLISNDFYYFGNKPVKLPPHLEGIVHQTQGHKSTANEPNKINFDRWIRGVGRRNKLTAGIPDYQIDWTEVQSSICLPCSLKPQKVKSCG